MKILYSLLFAATLLLTGCKQQELLKGLEQRQANEVISLLLRNNIASNKKDTAKEGYQIFVDLKDFSSAVELLRIYNLPSKPRMEIAAMFPADSLISSPLAETARLYSAIEQRLEQSLLALEGVTSAQVHVSYRIDTSGNSRKNEQEHVATLISYDRTQDSSLMISDIKRFIKNSFNNLNYDDISVVLTRSPTPSPPAETPVVQSTSLIRFWWVALLPLFLGLAAGYLYWVKRSVRSVSDV
ncbi:type III secretion inner membrane ring lipoprotein SctJ [Rouxiella badensis]|uniref:type III secretion system inner membrane ring lipoprotein SctJ n=1 Tax=Rouxiella badensis TaxID=1646377 RepID=UPI001D14EBD9|nr:type III secretion inner membrane ring lipoprotein SctJ [Rouxiella badensis]MCC3718007.1 type III secretion inner membrane ring lipoprotein SctJ [Rouxiella badensis]MCC3729978.1 type III secretion inner membrane ring lipoprotein SctJ [Rouxiella badensis]MCC3734249.1 type III secretion inner membrane ring lipoprotein SctJ [Rouxiella badensis]MCC3739286.1 type III secretion inner membrane ring lipoprotein SctJ [Rouxiella badensis]MCC3758787.1 type III secretion inner membrane ring lipoprotein